MRPFPERYKKDNRWGSDFQLDENPVKGEYVSCYQCSNHNSNLSYETNNIHTIRKYERASQCNGSLRRHGKRL
jgi:hypothetical protein